jgi:hypothetical protein
VSLSLLLPYISGTILLPQNCKHSNIVLTLGFKVFTFLSNSNPFRLGIVRSEITKAQFSLFLRKCSNAMMESLKEKTEITESSLSVASSNFYIVRFWKV